MKRIERIYADLIRLNPSRPFDPCPLLFLFVFPVYFILSLVVNPARDGRQSRR